MTAVRAALALVPFNCIFARRVVDGLVDGEVWVDHNENPSFVHVINSYSMSLLVVLEPDADVAPLAAHLHDYRMRAPLWLQVHPQEFAPRLDALLEADVAPADPLPSDVSVQRFTRVNFGLDRVKYDELSLRSPLSPGTALRPLTASEFALPGITVSPHMFWRDAEQFLSQGGGWCVCEKNCVCSIAFSSFRSDSELELGVETRPEYRGKGFARLACATLIDQCVKTGLTPLWSCRKENAASHNLALSLGFVTTFEGAYYHLPVIAPAGKGVGH